MAKRRPRSVWSIDSRIVCPPDDASSSTCPANGSRISPLSTNAFRRSRLSHCSRMSARAVSSGRNVESSRVFGVCPSSMAATASGTFFRMVFLSFGSASSRLRPTSAASFSAFPISHQPVERSSSNVTLKVIGGELDEVLWWTFEKRFGTMVSSYGLAERVCEGFYFGLTATTRRIGTIGKSIDIEVRVVDGGRTCRRVRWAKSFCAAHA